MERLHYRSLLTGRTFDLVRKDIILHKNIKSDLSKRWKLPGINVPQVQLVERISGSLTPTASTRMSTASQTSQWVVEKMCETLVFQGQCDRRVLWSSDRRRMPADLSVPRVKQDCMKRQNTLFVVH